MAEIGANINERSPTRSTVDESFKKKIESLKRKRRSFISTEEETREAITFSVELHELYKEARQLDLKSKSNQAQHFFLLTTELISKSGSANKQIWSKHNTIGRMKDQLIPIAKHVPAHLDHLYEVAVALRKELPVQEWIDSERLSAESHLLEIRYLSKPQKDEGTRRPLGHRMLAKYTQCSKSYELGAPAVKKSMEDNPDFHFECSRRGFDELKVVFGDRFESVKERIHVV